MSDFEMVPVSPVITGITFVFTFHLGWISTVRSIWKCYKLLSWSHFYPLKLQCLLTDMFPLYHHGLWCLLLLLLFLLLLFRFCRRRRRECLECGTL
jgi:hypothetical protein